MKQAVAKKTKQDKKTYTFDEVYNASLEYFFNDPLPADTWSDKYAMRNKEGGFLELTPDDMHDRLAGEFARIDSEKYGLDFEERRAIYRNAMDHFSRVVPQGSPMMAIGNPYKIMSASNCVVIESPEDSIEGIMRAATELAQLMKRRAGAGLDISPLRPEGFSVNNAARTTSGCWSFADLFSYVTRMIAQLGRRGALMVTLDVHHPDVIKFATMKRDLTKVTGANISIRLSDEFLEAVENDTTYEQRWPCEGTPVFTQQVSAREVWDIIIETATETAEPGLLFWDRMVGRLPAHCYPQFKTISCNPCAEIALSANDSCRLISINLTGYVNNAFLKPSFDWKLFKQDITTAMQMIDNLVDLEIELIEKIQSACSGDEHAMWQRFKESGEQGRRTGLGTHGLADMLAQMNIKYDSEEAQNFCNKLYKTLRDTAYSTSIDLAEVRGPFPAWDWDIEKENEFIQDLPESIKKRMSKVGRRNISILTQAPTGSVSLLSKCGRFGRHNISSGVEPIFRTNFTRRKKINAHDGNIRIDFTDALGDNWQNYDVYHGNVLNYMETVWDEKFEDLQDSATQNRLKDLFKELPDMFVTSDQIDWQSRVKLQGIEQQYLCHSISSTINLPRGTTSDVVSNIYLESWKQGLKGVTVYVDGSRDGVLITEGSGNKIDPTKRPDKIVRLQAPKRPKVLDVDIYHLTRKGEKWIALVGLLNDEPYEMFGGYSSSIQLPKKYKKGKILRRSQGKYDLCIPIEDESLIIKDIIGTFNDEEMGWTTRLVSTSLRHGTPLEFLVEQLQKGAGLINSFNKVLARVLKKYIPDGKVSSSVTCDNCQSDNLRYQEGCLFCMDCGLDKCN